MTKQDQLQQEFIDKTVEFFKTKNRGYLDLAMRFGKCRTTIEVAKKIKPGIILIAYPDNKLRLTWEEEIKKWSYGDPIIYFTNFSSLNKWTKLEPDLFIIDEFHSASDNERNLCHQIMTNTKDVKTLALSGTVSKETKEEWGIEEIAKYTTDDGIKDGILADYKITVHFVDLDDKVLTKNKKGKLVSEKKQYDNYTYVINQMKEDGRNSMFLALARNRLSLSSIGKMTYLKALLNKLKDKRVLVFTGLADVADKIGIASYHSKSSSDKGFKDFQEQKINHLALAAMGKMGVTYPNLDSVILMNFTYNAEESSQILNRAIKLDYTGKVADLHILCLRERAEIKKIKESLSMLDQNKIKYI